MKKNDTNVGKMFDEDLRSCWSENDLEKKRYKALGICQSFVFKTNKLKIISEIEEARDGKTIDRIITHACLSGEGLKVVK